MKVLNDQTGERNLIRRASLVETVRRDYSVTIVGPSTLSAFINSLQMGFRTLAIQGRSSEVWKLLGAVKTQFGNLVMRLRA